MTKQSAMTPSLAVSLIGVAVGTFGLIFSFLPIGGGIVQLVVPGLATLFGLILGGVGGALSHRVGRDIVVSVVAILLALATPAIWTIALFIGCRNGC